MTPQMLSGSFSFVPIGSIFALIRETPKKMKSIFLICVLFMATIAVAQKGIQFPNLSGETLDDKIVTIPSDTNGKMTLLGMASSEKAEEFLRGWYEPMYNRFIAKTGMFDDQYDLNIFFVPMFSGGQKIGKGQVMKSMKDNKNKELFPYVLFFEGNVKEYADILKMEKKDLPYIYLLDEQGKILYTTSGYFSQKKMDDMDEFIIK